MLLYLCCSVVIILYSYCVALLLFVLSRVLIVCTVPLPPGVNPIAVDNISALVVTLCQCRETDIKEEQRVAIEFCCKVGLSARMFVELIQKA